MDPTENIMEISILMNISICLIGIAIMVLNKGINTKVTIYTLILTIIALITFVITLLFNRKNMFIFVLITLVLSLAQFIIGILQIIATDNSDIQKKVADYKENLKNKVAKSNEELI